MKNLSILLANVLVVTVLLIACGRKGPVPPPDKTPPTVSSTIPANGSVNVPVHLSGGITITFSKEMDASTINDQTITLADGQNSVPGLVTYTDTAGVSTAVLTPSSDLNPATPYKIIVDINVKDSYGIPMAAPYICSFYTATVPDTTPPNIVDTVPGNGDVNIKPNAPIFITLSEPVSQATITFTLLSAGGVDVPCTTSYSGTNAIFTPQNTLSYITQYTATVRAGLKDLAGNEMPDDYIWNFITETTSDTMWPSVIAMNPAGGTNGVVVNIAPSVTFSELVDPATIIFTLSAGGISIAGDMTYSGIISTFTPSIPLAYGTQYTATVRAGVKDLAGNVMPDNYSWVFTTSAAPDTAPPSVMAKTPVAGATGVAVNIAPSVTFSELVDPATITFTLSAGDVSVAGNMIYSGITAIFTPSLPLAYGTQYTATVEAGVRDLAGNTMPDNYSWVFTTSAAPDTTPPSITASTPVAGASGVAVNIAPSVTFSEPVDPATITFTLLSADGAAAPGTMSYSGITAIFTPSLPLSYSTQYTASVSAGVKDLVGNAMPKGHFWSFTTGTALDMIPPYVTATTPGVGVANVATNIAPNVTFSEPVDPATITFTLISADGVAAPCTMSYSVTTAIFTPSSNLKKNMLYTARVKAGVRDLAGNAMPSDYFWSFKTK